MLAKKSLEGKRLHDANGALVDTLPRFSLARVRACARVSLRVGMENDESAIKKVHERFRTVKTTTHYSFDFSSERPKPER